MNNLKAALSSITISVLFFSLLGFPFIRLGILVVHDVVLTGLSGMILSILGLSVYLFLNFRYPDKGPDRFSLSISNLILGICVAMLFFGYLKWSTVVTFLILFALLLYIEYWSKLRFMYYFYRAWLAMLIPFYLLSTFVKNQPVLTFNEHASLKLYLLQLPIEAYSFFMGMLLITVYLFELFKYKMTRTDG